MRRPFKTSNKKCQGQVIILSGPSGSGKTTLHHKLILSRRFKGKLVKSISATTRPKRIGEKHGRDYLFLSQKEFKQWIATDQFLEWQKVFDHYYGTPKSIVDRLLKKGLSVLLCIDVKGARVIRKHFPRAVGIFIKTPTIKELKSRLEKRGSEANHNLRLRLSIAKKELKDAKYYEHIIINDQLTRAYRCLVRVVDQELKKGCGDVLSAT